MTKTYLAFDFGMKRIGVAVGQSLTQTATPLDFLNATDGIPNWQQICDLINNYKPEGLVVGIPLNMDGSEQEITFCARKFSNRLKEKFKLPTIGVDERLSTVEAKNRMFTKGGYKKLKKGAIDSMAAVVILEDFFRRS